MTVSTEISRVEYSGDGSTVAFTVPFYFLASGDLVVYKSDTLQTITTHYSVSGAGDITGGTVTFVTAPASTDTVVIFRDAAITQSVDYVSNDPFPAETHETALDRLTMIAQRNRDLLDRSLVLPDSDVGAPNMSVPDLDTRKSKTFYWDINGAPSVADVSAATVTFTPVTNTFSGDSSTTDFILTDDPGTSSGIIVSVGGVTQKPDIDFTVTSTTLSFTSAPTTGTDNICVQIFSIARAVDSNDATVAAAESAAAAAASAASAVASIPNEIRNKFINGGMRINQRMGDIQNVGAYQVLSRPYRYDSNRAKLIKPDGGYEDLSFDRGVTLDRWLTFINDFGATGGEGYIEQVKCIDADQWVTSTAYTEGQLVRAPSGGYGDGYVYRCVTGHTSGTWNTDVKTAIDPTSWQAIPKYWALYGIYETDPLLQNKYALHWVQSSGSSAAIALEQRILGVDWITAGTYTLSFLAKDRGASTVPVRGSVIQEMGVGQTDYTSQSANQNITGTATVQQHTITLTDPTSSPTAGYGGNNRLESVQVQIQFPTVGETFDLLITDIQFLKGGYQPFVQAQYEDELRDCQAYFWKTNPTYLPSRFASYVADAVAGTAQWNVLDVDQLWDRYGQIHNASSGESISWGGTNRAFQNNERETAGYGKLRNTAERQAKAFPHIGIIDYPTTMVREPTVKIYDVIGATEGYALNNERFKASLIFDHTGVGATPRPFAQRSLTKVVPFYATANRADFHAQNFDPSTVWEEFSSSVTLTSGQDAIPSAFLTLFAGYKYDWDWTASGSGTDVYYLHLANTQYYKLGAGSLLSVGTWASSTAYAVGDVVQESGTKRYWECMSAHTSTASPPDENDSNWRPYGRVTFPHKLQFDGVTSERSNIADPSALLGLEWWFGDNDSLGFKTVYVRMNAGAADPGSASGRLKMQSYDMNLDLYENLLCQATFDAEVYSL